MVSLISVCSRNVTLGKICRSHFSLDNDVLPPPGDADVLRLPFEVSLPEQAQATLSRSQLVQCRSTRQLIWDATHLHLVSLHP
jgi:hypothetical protein